MKVDVPESLPLVPVDYVQMEQVFTNLVSNSLKYAPANTVVCIRAQVEGELIHVQVSNQGPQVPPEHLERIFDKFYRITAADRVTGTGLGAFDLQGNYRSAWRAHLGGECVRMDWLSISPCRSPGMEHSPRNFQWIRRPNEQRAAYPRH